MTTLAELRALLKKEDLPASKALESLLAFESQDWVTVFHDDNGDEGGFLRMACFLRPEQVGHSLANPSFDVGPGDGRPGFIGHSSDDGWVTEYSRVGDQETVPLVFNRYPEGGFPQVVELSEDFRLFWDLYEDRTKRAFLTIDDVGDRITVAEWRDRDLVVSKSYLRRYQAARQLVLTLQIVIDRRGGSALDHLTTVSIDVNEDNVVFAYHGGDILGAPRPNFTRLLGKRLIPPGVPESSGVWPYEPPKQYETFIIDSDENGQSVTYSCDPDVLRNYFGANPDAPHYLTPVYFKRSAFDKYYADPDRYQIEDGYLRESNTWGLRMDNAHDNFVVVFLGDLGRDLPYREQQYWKSFNVPPAGGLSETAFRR